MPSVSASRSHYRTCLRGRRIASGIRLRAVVHYVITKGHEMTTEMGLCDPASPARINPDWFFYQSGTPEANQAKALCMACPLYFDCNEFAVTLGIEYGIWGGHGREDRRRIWKRSGGRPDTFDEHYSSQIRPLLQERRERETWDDRHPLDAA